MHPLRVGKQVRRIAGAVLLLPPVAACAGAHLYRAPEHQLAQRAQASFDDAKLAESIASERAVLDTLLAQELSAVRRQATARRDATLRAVLGGEGGHSWMYFDSLLGARISELAGTEGNARDLLGVAATLAYRVRGMERDADLYRLARRPADPEPSCPVTARPRQLSPDVQSIFNSYAARCRAYQDAQQALFTFATGGTVLGAVNVAVGRGERADSAQRAAVTALEDAYGQAKARFDAAVERRDASAVRDAAQQVRDRLAALEAAAADSGRWSDLGLTGRASALEKRLAGVDQVLDALLASGEAARDQAVPDSGRTALALLAWAPALERRFTAVRNPDVSALLLERESLRLRLDAARRRRASAAAQLALLRQKRALVVDEVLLLFRSKATLDGVRPRGGASAVATCPADASLAAAAQHGDARCRDAIVRALLVYANSWTLARTPEEEVDYRMIAARHAAVLDAAENALAQWQSLIKVPIDQLVSYHSGGVRPADVAALLSALGLGALAATNH